MNYCIAYIQLGVHEPQVEKIAAYDIAILPLTHSQQYTDWRNAIKKANPKIKLNKVKYIISFLYFLN